MSLQCGAVLFRDREGYACAIDQVRCAYARQTKLSAHDKAGAPRLGAHEIGILL